MATQTITCPHCGLTVKLETGASTTDFKYDAEEWKLLCKAPDLGNPLFCIPSQMLKPPPKRLRYGRPVAG